MASYTSNTSNQWTLIVDVTNVEVDTPNNRSKVSWSVKLKDVNRAIDARCTYHLAINGTNVWVSASGGSYVTDYTMNNTTVLASGTTGWIDHASNGSKSVSVSAGIISLNTTATWRIPQLSLSETLTLTTIPRYATITGFSASINDRSASLSWTADKTISQWRWSGDSGGWYSDWITVNASSGSTSISVTPGSTYGWRIQVINSASGLVTTSSVVSKTATKTPSTLTLSTTSQNVGSGIVWTINESYDYTHRITYAFGSLSGDILGSGTTGVDTSSGTWTLPTNLTSQIPNTTSGVGGIYIATYYGSVLVGTHGYAFTAIVPNNTAWQPTVPSVTISDVATRPTGVTSYVQGIAKAKVVSSSTAQGGASISSYRVTVSGIGTYYGSNITSGFLTNSGTITITVRATDSRGYYREKSDTITVVAYSPPKLTTYTASRSPDDEGTDLATSINFSLSSIDNQNGKHYRIRYRETGGTWVTLVSSSDYYTRDTTHSATGVLDVNKSYEVEFYLTDSYTAITQTRNIGTGFVLLDFNKSGKSMAIGKVSEGKARLEVFGNILLQNRDDDTKLALEQLQGNSGIEIGNPRLVGLAYIDFHSGGENVDYDARILVSGGGTSSAQGQMSIHAQTITFSHIPTVAGSGIWYRGNSHVVEETGSNENGRYIKFSDGTLLCSREFKFTATGTVIDTARTFPASSTIPQVIIPSLGDDGQSNWAGSLYTGYSNGVTYRLVAVGLVSGGKYILRFISWGRWK